VPGSAKLLVGVDGGNTKTAAVICDAEGQALGFAVGGASNWESMGETRAAAVILQVIDEALGQAGFGRGDLLHVHMGLAGQDWPEDEPRMRTALLQAGWCAGLTLENDGFLTIRAGAPEGRGVGVTAGTGICCAIIRPDGSKFVYAAFTDLGGGYDTSGETVRAVIRAEDGRGAPTALTPALLEATGHATVVDLVHAMHREGEMPSHRTVRPVLFSTAASGDPVAVDIVTRFAAELALCAANLLRRYNLADQDTAVVASGSLFMKTGRLLFDAFCREVLKVAPRTRMILTDHPPVMGAVRGALFVCGLDQPTVWQRLNREASSKGWFQQPSQAEEES